LHTLSSTLLSLLETPYSVLTFYQNIFEFHMDCRETVPHKCNPCLIHDTKENPTSSQKSNVQTSSLLLCSFKIIIYNFSVTWFSNKIPFTHPFKHSMFRIRPQSGLSLPGMFAIIWMDPWYTRHKKPCIALTPSNTKMGA